MLGFSEHRVPSAKYRVYKIRPLSEQRVANGEQRTQKNNLIGQKGLITNDKNNDNRH